MTADRPLSVVLAGGGSAGHVAPLLAIAAALKAQVPDVRLLAVGTASGLETRLVPAAGIELALIDRVPMPRKPSLDALRFPGRMRKAIKESSELLRKAEADVLLGVGGYVCTPMYSAARKTSVPVVIHEANIKPGLANRWGARYTKWIGKTFETTKLGQAQWVGMPMREEIVGLDRAATRQQARAALGLDAEGPVLLVTGGSLGAVRINKTLVDSLPALAEAGVQVLHITGRGKAMLDASGGLLSAPGYRQLEYVDAMEQAYAAADLMVSRAGAGTVSEVAAVGMPAVFVPLPVGNGEQAYNAATLTERDAALAVLDKEFTPEWLRATVLPLLQDPERLQQMSERAYRSGIRDAAAKMASMIVRAAR